MDKSFDSFLQECLKNPEVRAEYEALAPEVEIMRAMINTRKRTGMTQKQLAEATGIYQGDISKLERGCGNPSLKTLQRLAAGMGMTLKLEFVPQAN